MIKGSHVTPKTKARMIRAQNRPDVLENNRRAHLGEKNAFYGKKHTPEINERIRRAHLGKKWSAKRKRELSALLRKVKAGTHPPNYNGGVFKRNGYVLIWEKGHKDKAHKSDNYIFRSHLVIENIIGKSLPDGSIVHHVNKRKTDDRPENLMAFTENGVHGRFHRGKEPRPGEIIFDGRKYHAIAASQ